MQFYASNVTAKRRGKGRKYSESEVSKYKRLWEFTVRKRRRIFETHAPLGKKDWVKFEISGFIFELAVTTNLERAREILDLLDIHNIFEQVFWHNSTFILDELHSLVPFISSPEKSALVAEYVLHYFWHLPGPTYTKIKPADIRALGKAIDLLTWIAVFEALARRDSMPIVSSLTSLSELFETAHSYRQGRLKDKILRAIKSIKKEVSENRGYSDAEMAPLVKKTNIVLKRLVQVCKSNAKSR